uniref:Uncharacterized protein n=1 Tax=Schizaphis graminum TaxID=13262 RepID=A0A2S2PKF8_SCHGA
MTVILSSHEHSHTGPHTYYTIGAISSLWVACTGTRPKEAFWQGTHPIPVPVRVCDYFGVPTETRRVSVSSYVPLGHVSGVTLLNFFFIYFWQVFEGRTLSNSCFPVLTHCGCNVLSVPGGGAFLTSSLCT